MRPFSLTENHSPGTVSYKLSGYLGEGVDLPVIPFPPTILLHLGELTGLNSVGTRTWCHWVAQMTPPSLIRVEHCPFLLVKTFELIHGACPANMQVFSFYVPYFSEKTNESRLVLFVRGVHYSPDGTLNPPEVLDSQQNPMEMDVLMSYFKFIKR